MKTVARYILFCALSAWSLLSCVPQKQEKQEQQEALVAVGGFAGVYTSTRTTTEGLTEEVVLTLYPDTTLLYHSVVRGSHLRTIRDTHHHFMVDSNVVILPLPDKGKVAFLVGNDALYPLDENGHLASTPAYTLYSHYLPQYPHPYLYTSAQGDTLAVRYMNDIYVDNYVLLERGHLSSSSLVQLTFLSISSREIRYANDHYTLIIRHDRSHITLLSDTGAAHYTRATTETSPPPSHPV